MQPETAFWVLSSTAQASAALAGLSVLVMVFQLRLLPGLRPDVRQVDPEGDWPPMETVIIAGWAKSIQIVALSASLFLAAAIGSLVTLGFVTPSSMQVADPILLLLVAMLVLIVLGGALMAYYVWFLARNLAPVPRDRSRDYIEIESEDEGRG